MGDQPYNTDEDLRIRIEIHRRYTVGPALEPAIDEALGLQPDESLLDIGTGAGDFPRRLRRAGHRGGLVGIDASTGMIAKARADNAGVQFLPADAQCLPFPDGFFDAVSARHMLYHVADISRALREARRVLRHGGRFLAVTNGLDSMADYREALRDVADQLKDRIAGAARIPVPASNVFNEQNGASLVRAVFGNVAVSFVQAALRFESADPAIRYFDSSRTMNGFTFQEWAVARQAFAQTIAPRLCPGPWVIPKSVVLLQAEAPSDPGREEQ